MNSTRLNLKLPGLVSTGSFLGLLALVFLTSPLKNIIYAIAFFVLLLVFLVSVGSIVMLIQKAQITPKSRYRIFILSIGITVAVMFRSAGALGWIEALVLLLITLGLLFYSGRRL